MPDRNERGWTVRPWFLHTLTAVTLLRVLTHALFLPAFEGPDEPYHLARSGSFADRPFTEAFRGVPTDGVIVAAARARPCGPSLHNHFGCREFGSEAAHFNLLHPLPPQPPAGPVPNYENNQPPLYYAAMGFFLKALKVVSGGLSLWPEVRLLVARLVSVLFTALGVLLLLRLPPKPPIGYVSLGFLLVLGLPGASESLARNSNDAAVFLWCVSVLVALERRVPVSGLVILAAAGPLLKLTAFPVVAFAIIFLWRQKRRAGAIAAGISSLTVFPLQLLRDWSWGGTWELNRPTVSIPDSLLEISAGVARSGYTLVKTAFWLGNWTFFRPPGWLLVGFWALLVLWIAATRYDKDATVLAAHAAGFATAVVGVLLFFFASRRFWGAWGGVGGWYLWAWAPWLAIATRDLFEVTPARRTALLALTAGFVAISNVAYVVAALSLYGPH